jgi:hypothetical protein
MSRYVLDQMITKSLLLRPLERLGNTQALAGSDGSNVDTKSFHVQKHWHVLPSDSETR